MPLEREIKLKFDSASDARQRIVACGAMPLRGRRLQHDRLLDTDDGRLARRGCALRVRSDGARTLVTFKGPLRPGTMKLRDEHETAVDDGDVLLTVFEQIGLRPRFRYEKYREEFSAPEVVIAIDDTPIGVFVEIEGAEDRIHATAAALGKGASDYITASYRALYDEYCRQHATAPADMLF